MFFKNVQQKHVKRNSASAVSEIGSRTSSTAAEEWSAEREILSHAFIVAELAADFSSAPSDSFAID